MIVKRKNYRSSSEIKFSANSVIAVSSALSITANAGYTFIGRSEDGKTVVDPTTITVQKPITLTALYQKEQP